MKKTANASALCLLILLFLLPGGTLLGRLLGYRLELTKPWVYGLAMSGLSVWTALAAFLAADRQGQHWVSKREVASSGPSPENSSGITPEQGPRLLYALPLPLAFFNCSMLLLRSDGLPILLLSLVTLAACALLFLHGRRGLPRKLSLTLSSLLLVPLLLLAFASLFFGGIGQRRVVRQVPSPDGKLLAEIVDNDQGALGGATLVELCPRDWDGKWGVRLSRQIWFGPWGEHDCLELRWKDESYLEINGRDYQIR